MKLEQGQQYLFYLYSVMPGFRSSPGFCGKRGFPSSPLQVCESQFSTDIQEQGSSQQAQVPAEWGNILHWAVAPPCQLSTTPAISIYFYCYFYIFLLLFFLRLQSYTHLNKKDQISMGLPSEKIYQYLRLCCQSNKLTFY